MAGSLTLNGVSNLLFSSPHLIRVEERIRINGVPISSDPFEAALGAVRDAAAQGPLVPLTFFEATYLAAMQCASDAGVDVLILETGLGGRKDATRSGPATACLVTSVSAEHSDVLGDSLPEIAKEKAAISRPNCPILIRHPMNNEVQQAMLDEVQSAGQSALGEQQAPAIPTLIEIPQGTSVRNEGRILANAFLEKVGLPTSAMDEAFGQVRWPARMQRLDSNTTSPHQFLLDAAHNPSGLARVLPELEQVVAASNHTNSAGWTLVFGTSPQRDLAAFCQPLIDLCLRHPPHQLIITEPQGGRYPAASAPSITNLAWPCHSVRVTAQPLKAIQYLAERKPHEVGLVVSLGSLYLQGNILDALGHSTDEDLSLLAKQ
jgi:dihydrofolate synthase/folylpolyglutamate synthase